MRKPVWLFSEGSLKRRDLLGNKGANLCEMTSLGMPVPFGFIITTQTHLEYQRLRQRIPEGTMEEVKAALLKMEIRQGAEFGNPVNPLLVSVRSGASVSMPGMMDTLLNLGINDEIVEGMAKLTANPRFAYDTYRRFLQLYGAVVGGKGIHPYTQILKDYRQQHRLEEHADLDIGELKEIVGLFKQIHLPPENPWTQLENAIGAVFSSWNNPRAQTYRRLNEIPDSIGTAVIIQAMVFGNMGQNSGSGIAFTRNPSTGEKEFFGEYLMNAEGEDIASGRRTPRSLDEFKEESPILYNQLFQLQKTLEEHYRDMQDLEFTIQENRLYLLQTRSGKRTAKAAVKIAVDLVNEGLISEKEALRRMDPEMARFFMHPMIDPQAEKNVLALGLPASPGAVTGNIVFTPEDAQKAKDQGDRVILVRVETTPEDIHGMQAALGILTTSGGMTSHAALLARGMGRTCIVGCEGLSVDEKKQRLILEDGSVILKGRLLTLDGSSGEVMEGRVPTIDAHEDQDYLTLLSWADKYRRLKIRANAETSREALTALRFGAEGIGLCRTEHVFFHPESIDVFREMIFAQSPEEKQEKLNQLSAFQVRELKLLFKVMDGLPVNLRLLDPPLSEFLPQAKSEIEKLAGRLGRETETLMKLVGALHEKNPMLGFRGSRLSIIYPEISTMQMDSILTAAIQSQRNGTIVKPEIMVPLVTSSGELEVILQNLEQTAKQTFLRLGQNIQYKLGTMMEVPRACVQSRTVAPQVQFMSFDTHDLTQLTFGFSREDSGKFLPDYIERQILAFDPFIHLDQQGVGNLIRMALEQSRKVQKKMEYGICGDHGGDPRSIKFFHRIGIDYVSCSPHLVPVARLAAAKASI